MGREQVALRDLPVQPRLTVNKRLALNILSSEGYIFGTCRDAQKRSFVDEATGLYPVIFQHNLFITELQQGREVVPVWYKVIKWRNCALAGGPEPVVCMHRVPTAYQAPYWDWFSTLYCLSLHTDSVKKLNQHTQ